MADAEQAARPAGLFPYPPPAPPTTSGERLREAQTAAVRHGQHPLAVARKQALPLHPFAQRSLTATLGPRCGDCTHRRHVPGGSRAFPKCVRDDPVWRSHGGGSDVRASWPACSGYEEAR